MVTKMLSAYSGVNDTRIRMTASVVVIVCLIIIITGVISVQWPYITHTKKIQTPQIVSKPDQSYTNWQTWYGQSFSLHYPPHWYTIQNPSGLLTVSNENIPSKELVSPSGILVIFYTYTQSNIPDDVKAVYDEAQTAGSVVSSNPFHITKITAITSQGKPGFTYTEDMSAIEDNTLNYKINYVFQHNTQYVVLESFFNKALFDTYAPQSTSIANSLSF